MRLIDADELMELYDGCDGLSVPIAVVRQNIEDAPTIDAEPVRHGYWAHLGGDEWYCSNCGDVIFTEGSWEAPTSNYCSNCGAKMDEEAGK